MTLRGRENGERHVDLAGDGVRQRRATAAVRDVDDGHAGLGLEKLGGHVERAAGAGRTIGQFARFALREREQFLEVLGREVAVDHQHVLGGGHHADRCQVLQRVVRHLGRQRRVDRQRHGLQADRVAVGRRLGDRIHTEVASRAGLVLDEHRFAECLAPLVGDQAPDDVGAAAGGVGHNQLDGPFGVVLGPRRRRAKGRQRKGSQ